MNIIEPMAPTLGREPFHAPAGCTRRRSTAGASSPTGTARVSGW
jgi:hypothetical protein